MKLTSVPVDELMLGMYVAKLDRPWLETPFLFQGFVIDDDRVLEQLRQYCRHVYIDREQSETSDQSGAGTAVNRESTRNEPNSRTSNTGRSTRSTIKLRPTPPNHPARKEIQALRTELPKARQAHDEAGSVIGDAIQRIQAGKRIDLDKIGGSLDLMIDSVSRNEDALVWVTRMKKKDDYVYEHSIASSVWAMILGRQIGLENHEIQLLSMGAMLMDVGKTRLDDRLLTKSRLTKAEIKVVRRHVEFGLEIVDSIPNVDPGVREIVACHHERHDGSGYPNGLPASDIPLFARLAGVIDTYDAMTQPRPYAKPVSTSDAMRELNNLAGKTFAKEVVEQFVKAVGIYPVGSLVELNSGEVAVVIAQHKIRRLKPKIMLLLDRDKNHLRDFPIMDLCNQSGRAGDESYIERGLSPGAYGIDPSEYYL